MRIASTRIWTWIAEFIFLPREPCSRVTSKKYSEYIFYSCQTEKYWYMCYGTVTYPLMDSSKSYINREPSTLVGRSVVVRLDRDWIFDWQVSLAYATTFLCILLLQYIFKLIPCSELSFRGPKLGPRRYGIPIMIFNCHYFSFFTCSSRWVYFRIYVFVCLSLE